MPMDIFFIESFFSLFSVFPLQLEVSGYPILVKLCDDKLNSCVIFYSVEKNGGKNPSLKYMEGEEAMLCNNYIRLGNKVE